MTGTFHISLVYVRTLYPGAGDQWCSYSKKGCPVEHGDEEEPGILTGGRGISMVMRRPSWSSLGPGTCGRAVSERVFVRKFLGKYGMDTVRYLWIFTHTGLLTCVGNDVDKQTPTRVYTRTHTETHLHTGGLRVHKGLWGRPSVSDVGGLALVGVIWFLSSGVGS